MSVMMQILTNFTKQRYLSSCLLHSQSSFSGSLTGDSSPFNMHHSNEQSDQEKLLYFFLNVLDNIWYLNLSLVFQLFFHYMGIDGDGVHEFTNETYN